MRILPLIFAGVLLAAGVRSACPARRPAAAVPYSAPAYQAALQRLARRRAALADVYRAAPTPAARHACLGRARRLLLTALDSAIFPAWEGTPWTFYGQTWAPRRGSIACGYFVTTALHDAGLRLARTYLAKQASEKLIQGLTDEAHIRRFRGTDTGPFVRQVRALGEGLYVVGLDYHVAFLRVWPNGAVQMVHSSYLAPVAVVRQAADSAPALASNYRVLGMISADEQLLRRWLLNEALPKKKSVKD